MDQIISRLLENIIMTQEKTENQSSSSVVFCTVASRKGEKIEVSINKSFIFFLNN